MEKKRILELHEEEFLSRVVRLIPVLFVGAIAVLIVTIHTLFYCIPLLQIDVEEQYRNVEEQASGVRSLTVEFILSCLFLANFCLTGFTNPGRIPQTSEWKYEPNPAKVFEREDNGNPRFCIYERLFKPDRAHYCYTLKANVLKMDHYCPWVANCVGYFNYKFFFLSIFYSVILCLYISVTMASKLPSMINNPNIPFHTLLLLFLGVVLCGVILLITIPFLLFHCWLISNNMSTVELVIYIRTNKPIESPYDLGMWRNWQEALGKNPLLWLLPVPAAEGDGCTFERTDGKKVEEWPVPPSRLLQQERLEAFL